MRFRHKPTLVEAHHFGSDQLMPSWVSEAVGDGRIELISQGSGYPEYAEVKTPEGRMMAKAGVWIVKGISGELYVIQPELFEQLYEFDADGVVDTWAGNWIVTIEAPNGLQDSYYVDPLLVENSAMPASDMILGPASAKIRELFDRRHEEHPA